MNKYKVYQIFKTAPSCAVATDVPVYDLHCFNRAAVTLRCYSRW